MMFFGSLNNFVDCFFDTNIDYVVAVIGHNNVDKVFANVVNITTDCGKHHGALASFCGFFHVGFKQCHCGFHNLRRLKNKRQLHLSTGKAGTHDLHTRQQMIIDNFQCG